MQVWIIKKEGVKTENAELSGSTDTAADQSIQTVHF
jgi:hypothetical protein